MEKGKVKKEFDVLRAASVYKGCWVSASFVRNNLPPHSRVSGSIGVGKVLSRIGFPKKNVSSTSPHTFFIDNGVFDARLRRIVERRVAPHLP